MGALIGSIRATCRTSSGGWEQLVGFREYVLALKIEKVSLFVGAGDMLSRSSACSANSRSLH